MFPSPEPPFELLTPYPQLSRLAQAQLLRWPEHRGHLARSFGSHDGTGLRILEQVASLVLRLSGQDGHGLPALCADYRYVCEELILPEELFFRRHGRYRLATFAEAQAEVYGRAELMARYMNGLMLSSLFWANHAAAYRSYLLDFLPGNRAAYRHMEVGCGHGLLLHLAAQDPRCAALTGWDVSAASLDQSRRCLQALSPERAVRFEQRDLMAVEAAPPDPQSGYDSVVISEVLEHMEDPAAGLRGLHRAMNPGGRLFVNVPVNSPAPDHIYLLRSPQEALDLLRAAGFLVREHRCLPATGATLDRALRQGLTINTVIIAERP